MLVSHQGLSANKAAKGVARHKHSLACQTFYHAKGGKKFFPPDSGKSSGNETNTNVWLMFHQLTDLRVLQGVVHVKCRALRRCLGVRQPPEGKDE